MTEQLTSARKWVLECGLLAEVRGGYNGPSIITDFQTGAVSYGTKTRVLEKCKIAGWIDANGRTTDKGREALSPSATRDNGNG